ncbi:MAG: YdeI/OmpD-associated family protein [Actinomycetota bacterium]|nr:YdeI/OmpD-associated family protein [Actinomycetota bacterium]
MAAKGSESAGPSRARFRATLELRGKTATGFAVPPSAVASLGSGKRPAVRVIVGAGSYRTTVAPMGGEFLIPVSAERRAALGLTAGDEVDVELELDTAPREVEVPADLADALGADPVAKQFFESLSYSRRLGYVGWVESAKKEATRQRRVAEAIELLRAGRADR